MKKALFLSVMLICFVFNSFAVAAGTIVMASSDAISISPTDNNRGWGNQLTIKLTCTAGADGTFTSQQITAAYVPDREGYNYWQAGYYLSHAYTINDATTYPGSGAVTITGSDGQQLVGSTAGDTLTLSTSASGLALLSSARSAAQRPVNGALTISVTDTGDAANIFTLYLVLVK